MDYSFKKDLEAAQYNLTPSPEDMDQLNKEIQAYETVGAMAESERQPLSTAYPNTQQTFGGTQHESPLAKSRLKRQCQALGLEEQGSGKQSIKENLNTLPPILADWATKGWKIDLKPKGIKGEGEPTKEGRRWSDTEVEKLLQAILGPNADKLYEQLAKNRSYVYSKLIS